MNPQTNQETSKPKLAPLNEGGVSELLNKVKLYCIKYEQALIAKFDCCYYIQI